MTDRLDALYAIQNADPDGGQRQPTELDYARHKRWAVETFGPAVWSAYVTGGWDDRYDEEPRHVEY